MPFWAIDLAIFHSKSSVLSSTSEGEKIELDKGLFVLLRLVVLRNIELLPTDLKSAGMY